MFHIMTVSDANPHDVHPQQRGEVQASSELLETSRRHRRLLANLRGMAYRCLNDEAWTMEFVSEGCRDLLGISPEALTEGRIRFADLVHPDDVERVRQQFNSGLSLKWRVQIEYRVVLAKGRVKWVWEQGCGVYSEDGTLQAIEGFITDITRQKENEIASAESERFLRGTLDALDERVAILDERGQVLEANRAWCGFDGWNKTDPRGFDYLAYCDSGNHWPGTIGADIAAGIREVVRGGREAFTKEYSLGDDPERNWYICHVTRFSSGPLIRVVVTHQNVTSIRLVEDRLRASTETFSALADSAPVGIFRTDAAGRCLFVNAQWTQLTGLNLEQVQGEGWVEALHRNDRNRVLRQWEECVAAGRPFRAEFRFQKPDGEVIWVVAQAEEIGAEEGGGMGFVGTVCDITPQKLTEDVFRALSIGAARLSDEAFFRLVVRKLARMTHLEMAFVGALDPGYPEEVTTLAFWNGNRFLPQRRFPLGGAPGQAVFKRRVCIVEDGLEGELPDHDLVREHRVRSYAGIPLWDRQGEVLGLLVVMSREPMREVDLVKGCLKLFAVRTAAEIERERSVRLFQELFECAPDALVLVDTEGVIRQGNRRVEGMFGWPRAEWIGRPFEMLVPRVMNPGLDQMFNGAEVLEEIPLQDGGRKSIRCAREDGRIFPAEISLAPLQTWEGLRIAVAIRDITERVEAEAQAEQALILLDAIDDAVFIFSARDWRFHFVNQGAIRQLGYSRAELLRFTPLDIQPDFDAATFRQVLDRLVQGESLREQFTTRHRRKHGAELSVEVNLQYITPEGTSPMFLAVIRDISERLKVELQAQRTQRLESIGQLASGLAHDLNNALAPILMATEILRVDFPEAREMLDTVAGSARRGAGMVRQLLTFAKGAEGERILLQPKALIQEMEKIVKGTFPKGIRLHLAVPDHLWPILGDATQLHQVLLNLCVNARDAMPRGGTLEFESQNIEIDKTYASEVPGAQPGPHVMISIKDSGTGIDAEVMERIFEPFYSTKGPELGTGLGLSTVIGIVKGHGGFVRVYSEPGRGSTFTIYLPAASEEEREIVETPPLETDFRANQETLLLVDDEPNILQVVGRVLQGLNFRVITAGDGPEALIRAAENRDTLKGVITDLHMPHLDGVNLMRAFKRMLPDAFLIVASGRFEEDETAEFQAMGISAMLNKPFTQQELVAVLRTFVEGNFPEGE